MAKKISPRVPSSSSSLLPNLEEDEQLRFP
jgi:hypothetical protein